MGTGAGMGVGMGSSIVGGELQGWASALEQQAMADAITAEMRKQTGYQQQAMGMFNQYVPSLSAENAYSTMGNSAQNRMNLYNQAQPLLANAPPVAQQTKDALNLGGQARAKYGAYGDWQSQQGIGAQNQQDVINRIVNAAQGQAQLFPYQLAQAQHSQDPLMLAGAGISSIGGQAPNYQAIFGQPMNPYANPGWTTGQQPPPQSWPAFDPNNPYPSYFTPVG